MKNLPQILNSAVHMDLYQNISAEIPGKAICFKLQYLSQLEKWKGESKRNWEQKCARNFIENLTKADLSEQFGNIL